MSLSEWLHSHLLRWVTCNCEHCLHMVTSACLMWVEGLVVSEEESTMWSFFKARCSQHKRKTNVHKPWDYVKSTLAVGSITITNQSIVVPYAVRLLHFAFQWSDAAGVRHLKHVNQTLKRALVITSHCLWAWSIQCRWGSCNSERMWPQHSRWKRWYTWKLSSSCIYIQ